MRKTGHWRVQTVPKLLRTILVVAALFGATLPCIFFSYNLFVLPKADDTDFPPQKRKLPDGRFVDFLNGQAAMHKL